MGAMEPHERDRFHPPTSDAWNDGRREGQDNWSAAGLRRIARGDFATRSGARHKALALAESLAYFDSIHRDYCAYAGRDRFAGTIAEIVTGAGDRVEAKDLLVVIEGE